MPCLPNSNFCDRNIVEPFINHINFEEGKNYKYEVCLDKVYRDSAQPEILYSDTQTGERLVIERKNLVWPENYPIRHKNDHYVSEIITNDIIKHLRDGFYELRLEYLIQGTKEQLFGFAKSVGSEIVVNLPEIKKGYSIGDDTKGRMWEFFKEDITAREWDEPNDPLVIKWRRKRYLEGDECEKMITDVTKELNKFCLGCIKKFRNYSDARKILLIEDIGEFILFDQQWNELLNKKLNIPVEIDEIWSALQDRAYDGESYDGEIIWFFEKRFVRQ